MEIKFYTTKSEFNRLEKTLENEITLEGNFKNEVDIMAPIICVKNTSIAGANYVHIPDLGRYYFIDKIEITRTQLLTIFLSLDVLMSYKDEIKKLEVIVRSSKSNPYYSSFISGYDVRTDKENYFFPENNFNTEGAIILVGLYGERGQRS